MSQTPSFLEQGWQNLKVDLNKLRSDLAEVAQALMEAGKAEATEAKSRLQELAEQRLNDVRQALDVARQRGQSASDVVKQQVEEKPLLSLAIAFGAGMLLGLLTRRR